MIDRQEGAREAWWGVRELLCCTLGEDWVWQVATAASGKDVKASEARAACRGC